MADTTKAREAVALLQCGIVNFNDVDRECVATILAALADHDRLKAKVERVEGLLGVWAAHGRAVGWQFLAHDHLRAALKETP